VPLLASTRGSGSCSRAVACAAIATLGSNVRGPWAKIRAGLAGSTPRGRHLPRSRFLPSRWRPFPRGPLRWSPSPPPLVLVRDGAVFAWCARPSSKSVMPARRTGRCWRAAPPLGPLAPGAHPCAMIVSHQVCGEVLHLRTSSRSCRTSPHVAYVGYLLLPPSFVHLLSLPGDRHGWHCKFDSCHDLLSVRLWCFCSVRGLLLLVVSSNLLLGGPPLPSFPFKDSSSCFGVGLQYAEPRCAAKGVAFSLKGGCRLRRGWSVSHHL
jgi:hypothetical protein